MTSPYIPPALRRAQAAAAAATISEPEPIQENEYQLDDISHHFKTGVTSGTLNSPIEDRSKICHIMVYSNGHPEWPTKLYCKSHFDLLKPYVHQPNSDVTTAELASIPVFRQKGPVNFCFEGFYKIKSVKYLEPRSPELISVMEAKFPNRPGKDKFRRGRSAETWKNSLALKWAIVGVERDEERDGEDCGVVMRPRKKVNEMLEEMRSKGEDQPGGPTASGDGLLEDNLAA
ncbi:MAG: hypothetical protein M4579_004230 [Chaenotheca gracillima]|nr:MAG: hypothetical protein M4579_004230 [Chaenotheca gracillima]